MKDRGTEIGQLIGLFEGKALDNLGIGHQLRIGGEDTIYMGVVLKLFCIEDIG